ncbi:MAG: flagellar motor switch protein FliN [Pseudonocardiales bacterium]|nr:MAG: flagellar motor switch protein FliN [Pseudonocardiales bacterium]
MTTAPAPAPAPELLNRALAAATAAIAVLPAPDPLTPGVPVTDAGAFALSGLAVAARFAGAANGEVVIVVTQDLVEALKSSPLGQLDLAAAVQPALAAAAGTLGEVLVDPGQVLDPSVALEALAGKGQAVYVPLQADSGALGGALGLVTLSPVVPRQRQDPVTRRAGLDLLHDVEMEVTAELGRTRMTIRELLSLTPGAVVELDRAVGSPADLLVNGRLIARGEVVVIDEEFGIRITEIVSPSAESEA